MKKIVFILTLISFTVTPLQKVKADEGMWFLMFIERLNHRDMQKMGLQLTAEEIYSINNNSLKDAIVQFNGGCTAEIVSNQGLVLTNHHCGYGAIAELSTPENDYLTNGWWAKNKSEELKPKSLYVRFFVRMDDVSERILSQVNEQMTEDEREKIINQEIAKIEQENNEGGKYTVSVRSFFQGNEYYYFVYQDYTDVRFVGAPPSSIGKYGGDTDNWEWPRHTGDFSMFRVYGDEQGNPAQYSNENVPLQPKHHLPINIQGYKPNDFAMILGYPGRTNRWMPAAGIDQNVNYAYPAWVESSKTSMDEMKKHMDKNQKVKLDYASSYASVANYWKNRQGMIDALKQHKTASTKRVVEDKFNDWANKKKNKDQYGNVMSTINNYYSKTNEQAKHNNYLIGILRTSSFAVAPYRLNNALQQYAKENEAKRSEMRPQIEELINSVFDGMYLPLEQDVLTAQLNLYSKKAKSAGLADFVNELAAKNNNNFSQFVSNAFSSSIYTKKDQLLAFLDNPTSDISNDPLFLLSNSLMNKYREKTAERKVLDEQYSKAYRLMVKGLRESKLNSIEYPDANSTLRLTYGKVMDLPLAKGKTNDAKENYYTTLKGTIAKHKEGDEEFENPQRLIDLYNKKDYGEYADKDGSLHVNFLTNNDITGGNSGSPVLNGKGELIGLAFDGNIEAMAGDVIFDEKLQRTINVDARYILFIIDKYAGAKHIIEELDIVK